LTYNFKKADVICATSNTIKEYIAQVINKPVSVIPFGIDVNEFSKKNKAIVFAQDDFILGSIKPLEPLYKIDVLIKSFAQLHVKYPHLRLMIIGEGSAQQELINLCKELTVFDKVKFTGRIPFHEISKYYNMLDVLVNLSEYESFGVSIIEAMACEKPVVVTNVGGLKEIVKDDSLGFKVAVDSVEQTAKAIEMLISDKECYNSIAQNARKYVVDNFNWNDNIDSMMRVYTEVLIKKLEPLAK
jgi:glycosyltransferase involved in cell wall biosynthesis